MTTPDEVYAEIRRTLDAGRFPSTGHLTGSILELCEIIKHQQAEIDRLRDSMKPFEERQ